ncbi:MAG TPA: hypothetical protein VF516_02320 [Kofleriaceae bacterium]
MKYLLSLSFLLIGTVATAAPQNNVCVPRASGVPTREGPPKWLNWTGSGTIPADTALDDPRWLGATGDTFALGSAKAPLQSRMLFSVDASGQEYLYLSFIVDLDGFDTSAAHPSVTTPRDLFIGFHRPTVPAGATQHGYMFQFHLTGGGSGVVAPQYCGSYATCDESSPTPHDFWRLFADLGHDGSSVCTGNGGRLYEPLAGATPTTPPVTWVTTAAGDQDAVRFWKVSSSDPTPLLQNRWAVQVRIPVIAPVAGTGSPIVTGVERGSTFFYEATAKLAGPGNGIYAKVGWFPLSITTSVCPDNNTDTILHEELGDPSAGCSTCDPTKFSKLSDLTGAAPADCDAGLDIDADHIGTLFNTPVPADPEVIGPMLGRQFGARDTTTPNHVIALPFNTKPVPGGGGTANDITAPIQARFRLAGWGSAPWSDPTDLGRWKDIRGAASGICGTAPAAGSTDLCGASTIPAQKHGIIKFDWTIGGDTGPGGIGSSEYCEFGLTPPAGSGETCATGCSCADPTDCAAGTGVHASKAGAPGTFWPCVPSIYQFDQCMLVELNAPNGGAHFVHQSIWSNMSFGEMSTLAHEALIDARHLPVAPGQQYQDIYFIAMPRNMPPSVPATSTSVQLAQNAAINVALRIAQPYLDDLNRTPPLVVERIARSLPRAAAGAASEGDERIRQILRARQIMSVADARRVDGLLQIALRQGGQDNKPSASLVHASVAAVGSSTTAEIVPTLEIYPYYQKLGKGRAYEPMTSFSVFLSHENTLAGIRYQIDGADQVGQNIYHLRIPVGNARKIQIRAQALTGNEAPLPPGNPVWPCAGGCAACGGVNRSCGLVAAIGSGAPGLLACVWVIGRRRKQPKRRG